MFSTWTSVKSEHNILLQKLTANGLDGWVHSLLGKKWTAQLHIFVVNLEAGSSADSFHLQTAPSWVGVLIAGG